MQIGKVKGSIITKITYEAIYYISKKNIGIVNYNL
jgi:hypothetical protein